MSRRLIGTILLFIASMALGVGYAEWSNQMFVKMIPPVALTAFNQSAAHVTLIFSGVVLGLVIFVLSIVSNWIAGMFPARHAAPRPSAP